MDILFYGFMGVLILYALALFINILFGEFDKNGNQVRKK